VISGVLFDLDGTLLDCIMPMQEAFVKVVESMGVTITEEERRNVGENLSKILITRSSPLANISFLWRLGKYVGLPPHKRVHMIVLTYYRLKYIANNSNLFNGVPEVLEALRNRGVKMAIVTTRSRKELLHILKMFSIESYFGATVSRDDVKNGKPSPDPLLFALKQLGLRPDETAMVGDMPTDIEAGKHAGTKTVGLLNGIFKKELMASNPDASINSIVEVPAVLSFL